jgi:hypothetical protein
MKLNFYRNLILLVIAVLSISACKKDNSNKQAEDLAAVKESALADDLLSHLFTQLSAVATESKENVELKRLKAENKNLNSFGSPSSCANITVTPAGKAYPKKITIDFGEGCTFNDVIYKGKLLATLSGSFMNKGASLKLVFDEYYLNDNRFKGELTILNNGKNSKGNLYFTLNLADAQIINPEFMMTWEAAFIIEWIKGRNTLTSLDDEFMISGSSGGISDNGEQFTSNIIKPLTKKASCRYITSGTAEHKLTSGVIQVLDYGNDSCDNKATLTVNGLSKDIILRK